MALIVQKYGGTSVGTVEKITNVAKKALAAQKKGNNIVVVVSAMSGETNKLVALANAITEYTDSPEYDMIVSTGEQVTIGLLALAIKSLGGTARAFTGFQLGIKTDKAYSKARIESIDSKRVFAELKKGKIVVVAGFQGVDDEGNITTLGRGGSDTSAVAVAAAIKADVCEIYTDVDGVYTTDPRIEPNARKLDVISYDEMLELASLGSKVLQIRSVEFAKKYNVPVLVKSTFIENAGTLVTKEEKVMEKVVVSGVAYDKNDARVSVLGIADQPGVASKIFGPISMANIVVDMIIQNSSVAGFADLTFTVPKTDLKRTLDLLAPVAKALKAKKIVSQNDIAKVSIVGVGMKSHSGVAARMFEILSAEKINILMIATSEIKISVVIEEKYMELAVRVLHQEFVIKYGKEKKAAVKKATAKKHPKKK